MNWFKSAHSQPRASLFKAAVHPEVHGFIAIKTCSLCIEPGATKRICCNALYCDHCYTKNNKCPNCDTLTKQEKITGATYSLKVFSEHEECRVCLDPGLKRRCCNNYYCDDCYYKSRVCRSCGAPVGHIGDSLTAVIFDKAAIFSVILGWLITIFVTLAFILFFAIVIASELQTPTGIFDYKCYGFFRECGVSVCIDVDYGVANGTQAIPPLSDWKKCKLNSIAKLQSKACIYDYQLYWQSQKSMGYDICMESFNEGVYIFEDTFENWNDVNFTSNTMVSAKWDNIFNGHANNFCKSGEIFGGRNSLIFQGTNKRYAETQDLDLTSGGRIESEIFMPPIGFDVSDPECKTGYIGIVYVEYSYDHGETWYTIQSYNPSNWRQHKFFHISLEIPRDGWTNSTRFRFIQPTFESARDNWALDNVKVLRYLPKNWHYSDAFKQSYDRAMKFIQKAQCCVDTDWCNQRYSEKQTEQCWDEFSWFNGTNYLIRLSEIFLCLTTLLNILKFLYNSGQDYLMKGRVPFQDELQELVKTERFQYYYKKIPLRYRPKLFESDEYCNKMHTTARMEEELRAAFNDNEGDGELVKRQELIQKEKKQKMKKLKKINKKLQARMKNKNFQVTNVELKSEDEEFLEMMQNEGKGVGLQEQTTKFSQEDAIATDLDKYKRQNIAMLRIPFEIETNEDLRKYIAYTSIGLFMFVFIFTLTFAKEYTIFEPVDPYGIDKLKGKMTISSVLLIFFAFYCDSKEIFHCLKHVFSVRKQWLPRITVDLSDEVRCLFINQHIIPIENIKEIQAFPESFNHQCLIGFCFGLFPWCLFSMLLREAYLEYTSMRIVTPFFGTMMTLRAIMGPGYIVKMMFALKYLYDINYQSREKMGLSCQSNNTFNTAYNHALIFICISLLICSAVAFTYMAVVFGVALGFGIIYGSFTGCIHNLPIKPWMYLTTIRGGVWMTLKKRQKCPCVYWGKYCTDMHNFEEVFIVYTTDELKFMSMITNGINAVTTEEV